MREIEMKARVSNPADVKACFDNLAGEGSPVYKDDHYFRLPGSNIQSMRIRRYDGKVELTCKRTSSANGREDNREFEFLALPDQYEKAVAFFHALGHEDFFIKRKKGWEWNVGDAHVELLSVNDIGTFLEIEILLPFDSDDKAADEALSRIAALMERAGICDIEKKSYREMILEKEGRNGIQG